MGAWRLLFWLKPLPAEFALIHSNSGVSFSCGTSGESVVWSHDHTWHICEAFRQCVCIDVFSCPLSDGNLVLMWVFKFDVRLKHFLHMGQAWGLIAAWVSLWQVRFPSSIPSECSTAHIARKRPVASVDTIVSDLGIASTERTSTHLELIFPFA